MSRTLNVNCIIDGDSEKGIFTIQIAATKNISALRDEIKIRREDLFRNIVAVELTLHPAFTTYEKIKDLKLPLATLNPLFRLSEVFANLNPKEIHVIITPPPTEESLAYHYPSKTRRLSNNNDIYCCWSWWRHVRGLKLEDRLQSVDCLTFPEIMLGQNKFGSTMFVRKSYKDLYNQVVWNQLSDPSATSTASKHSYIITGTPGIGNSFFGVYFIYRFAHDFPNANIIWQSDSLFVILLADGGIIYMLQQVRAPFVAVLADGNIADADIAGDLIGAIYSNNTFCVADATQPLANRQFVLVSSPKADRFKKLLKEPKVYMLDMPIWDETELAKLRELRFSSVDESVWRGYYDKWGGIPRSALEKSNYQDQQILEQRSNNIDIDSYMKSIGTDRYMI